MNRRSIRSRAERFGVMGLKSRAHALVSDMEPKNGSVGIRADSEPPMAVLERLSEKALMAMIVTGLEQRGYLVFHVPDSRRMQAGLSDLIFVHPANPYCLYVWELKREVGGVVSPEQQAFIDALKQVQVIDARIVKPSDWWVLKETV